MTSLRPFLAAVTSAACGTSERCKKAGENWPVRRSRVTICKGVCACVKGGKGVMCE